MRKITVIIIFLCFFCAGMAPLPPAKKPSLIKGKVTDSSTGQFIIDAQVKLISPSGKLKVSGLTDVNGNYELKDISFSKYGSYCILKVSKEGYFPKSTRRFFTNGKTYTVNFSLKPRFTPNHPPNVKSLIPADNSTFLAGAKIVIQIDAADPDKDSLEYQFSIGGTVIQPWSSSNTYTWQTQVSDTGSISITCEVRDNKGGQDTKTISCQIINPSVEEILQKVADNYDKIYDFKAKMQLSVTLDSQPLGKKAHYVYYFKKPNKEKIAPDMSSEDSEETEITIIDGPKMFLVEPLNKTIQEVNLLEKASISQAQFNQQDIYYNLPEFINGYTLTKNEADSDSTNFIVAIEAVPKIENSLYTKLELFVDYNKGLLIKWQLFKENTLREKLEVQESELMPNGAWVPTKMVKTPQLTSGNLVTTLRYSDIEINIGLRDEDFDPAKQ